MFLVVFISPDTSLLLKILKYTIKHSHLLSLQFKYAKYAYYTINIINKKYTICLNKMLLVGITY